MTDDITLVVTILRPPTSPTISADDAAAAVGHVVETMIETGANAAHMICRADGSFSQLSGHLKHRTNHPYPETPKDE